MVYRCYLYLSTYFDLWQDSFEVGPYFTQFCAIYTTGMLQYICWLPIKSGQRHFFRNLHHYISIKSSFSQLSDGIHVNTKFAMGPILKWDAIFCPVLKHGCFHPPISTGVHFDSVVWVSVKVLKLGKCPITLKSNWSHIDNGYCFGMLTTYL